MSADRDLGLLPPPPWRLQRDFVPQQRRRQWSSLALFAGLAVMMWWIPRDGLIGIVSGAATRGQRTTVVPATFDGRQKKFGRLTWETDGRVTYVQADGGPVQRRLEMGTLWPFDVHGPLTVAYDPQAPENWSPSWNDEQFWNRVSCAAVFTAFGVAAAVWLLRRWILAVRMQRLGLRIAPDGIAALGTLVGVKDSYAKGQLRARRYRVAVATDDREWNVSASFPAGAGQPLLLPGNRVLVILPADGSPQALVLRQDLWPLWLTDEQVGRACEILQRIDPTAGWRATMTTRGMRMTCSPPPRRRALPGGL